MTAPAPSRKRRWLSISLRGLLLVFTLLALFLGWYANRALRQRAVVAAVLKKGGRIYYLHNDPIVVADPTAAPAPPLAGLLGIDFVDTVTVVELIGPQFDDADLRLLDDVPQVRWLRIYETRVTGATFDHVARCRHITSLLVNRSPLEDSAVVEIGRMPQLTLLHLVDTRITDAELGALASLQRLESVSLSGCSISEVGLAKCQLPDTITELSLENNHIGDGGMQHLKRLPRLARLTLYGSQVTDQSIPELSQMPQLLTVMLGSTKVTNDGLRQLQTARGQALYVSPDPDGNR